MGILRDWGSLQCRWWLGLLDLKDLRWIQGDFRFCCLEYAAIVITFFKRI